MDSTSNSVIVKNLEAYKIILVGISLGIIISVFDNVFIPFILPSIFSIVILFFFKRDTQIRNVLLIGLWLRIFFAVIYYFYLSTKPLIHSQPVTTILFGGDGEFYSGHAWWVSVLALGKDIAKNNFMGKGGFFSDLTSVFNQFVLRDRYIPMDAYQVGFFTYLIALIYSMFGYCPLLVNFINCILGVLVGLNTYLIALKLFNKKVANTVLIVTLFFPSLFVWSALTKLKEPLYIFLITLFLLLCMKFIEEKKLYQLLLMTLGIVFLDLIRNKSFFIIFPVFIITLLLSINISFRKKIMLLIMLFIFIKLFAWDGLLIKAIKKSADSLMSLHHGMVFEGGIVYKLRDGISYTKPFNPIDLRFSDYIIFYFKAIIHFWFEPFPNRILSKSLLIFFPQQIMWFIFLLFFYIGILPTLRKNGAKAIVLLSYLFMMSSALALSEANIGTMVRHRDFITPVVIVFSCVGFINMIVGVNSAKSENNL